MRQLREPTFVDTVATAVQAMGRTSLVLEITERQGIGDDPVVVAAMSTIAAMGVRFAIDDFGVGFSSISYLQDLPAHIVKVDATLSQNIDHDDRACAVLRAIAVMGEALGLDVVVEGIERESQLTLIRDDVHAPFVQGYLMHRPMPVAQVLDVVRTNRAPQPGAVSDDPPVDSGDRLAPISDLQLSGPRRDPAGCRGSPCTAGGWDRGRRGPAARRSSATTTCSGTRRARPPAPRGRARWSGG